MQTATICEKYTHDSSKYGNLFVINSLAKTLTFTCEILLYYPTRDLQETQKPVKAESQNIQIIKLNSEDIQICKSLHAVTSWIYDTSLYCTSVIITSVQWY